MSEWNEGLYLLGQRLDGCYLGSPTAADLSAVLLLDHRGTAVAVHGYQTKGPIRDSLITHTCVTLNLALEAPFSFTVRPKNAVRQLLQKKGDRTAPDLARKFQVESDRADTVWRLLRTPALANALTVCPKTDLSLTPDCGWQKTGTHTLRIHTTVIRPDYSWTGTALFDEGMRPIALAEGMVELAKAACDAALDFRL